MSKVKALDELREIAADINASEIVDHMKLYPSCVFDGAWLDAWHDEFYRAVDRLESEIAERYMELPVDADGVPIRVGENLRSACSETEYTALGFWFDFDCSIWQVMVSSKQAMSGNMLRHVKPRTVEDVLRDFLDEKVYTSKTYERYAAEIRELLGVGK